MASYHLKCFPTSSVVTEELSLLGAELRSALVSQQRLDGSPYLSLREGSPSWMGEAIYALHDDESPNDWRYDLAMTTAEALADWHYISHPSYVGQDAQEIAAQIAETIGTVYTSDLLRWYSENPSRLSYAEEAKEIYGPSSSDDIGGALQLKNTYILQVLHAGQHYAAEQGALRLLAYLGLS